MWPSPTSCMASKYTPSILALPPSPALLQVFTEKTDAFDMKKVDGDTDDDLVDPDVVKKDAKQKRMYALKAHLEHEFDAVRGGGAETAE